MVGEAKAAEHTASADVIKQQTKELQNKGLRDFIQLDTEQLGADGARLKDKAIKKLAANLGLFDDD